MLTAQEEEFMREIYADIIDDLPDDEMMEMVEELDKMCVDDQFDHLLHVGKSRFGYFTKERIQEFQWNRNRDECSCANGCNVCYMTEW